MLLFNFVLCFVSNNLQNYIVWIELMVHKEKRMQFKLNFTILLYKLEKIW